MSQLRIPAVYMRGGTSKGVFFVAGDLPADAGERERVLLRVIGSPDRYGKHIDGMGGATSSTSKVVILSKSTRPDCDVDYRFGQVAIDQPVVDWSGNCGNLSAAVGPFAISAGLVDGAGGRHCGGSHLAGQHRQEDRCARSHARRRSRRDRRVRARRRGLPRSGGSPGVPRSGRGRRGELGRRHVPDRQSPRHARRSRCRPHRGNA